MSGARAGAPSQRLHPEKVAYWYFRLNGFLQIENFVVHPARNGGQRTDADLLAVRFPFRAERLFDDPDDIMQDDAQRLALSADLIDVVIAEVKTNQPCTLNGPWTNPDRQNVHRVLAALGCIPSESIASAANNLYETGVFQDGHRLRIRLVAVGFIQDQGLRDRYPAVRQLIWDEVLTFMWERFRRYRRQKKDVDQWDCEGKKIKHLAAESQEVTDFVAKAKERMGVNNGRT
jgi:hypothetical protein